MSRLLTLLAVLALATGLAVAQEQPPAPSQPGQQQAAPPSQQPPAQSQPGQPQSMPQSEQPPQPQRPGGQGQSGMSSQDLQAAFQRTFAQYPELSNVKVNVADDKIELSGNVPNQGDKDKLRRTAEANADGRKVVDDNLKVGGGSDSPEKPPMSEKPPASDKPPMSEKPPILPR